MIKGTILVAFLIGCFSQIGNAFGELPCNEACKTGYSCINGECKLDCGGVFNVNVECPDGYQCMGSLHPEFGGYCEKLNCGGSGNIPCNGGYWCKIIKKSAANPMGVCTDEACPIGCAIWNNGCNTCECKTAGFPTNCSRKRCKRKGTPYCVKERDLDN